MPWARFDDRFDQDRDLAYLTEGAVALHLCATTWCSRNLTDGHITKEEVKHLFGYSPSAVKALTSKCAPGNKPWWETTSTGYRIRSFLEYNPSKDIVEATREERRAAGRRGGQARWEKAKSQDEGSGNDGKTPGILPSTLPSDLPDSLPSNSQPNSGNSDSTLPSKLDAPYSRIPGIKQVATQELGMPNSNLGVDGLENPGNPNASGGLEISEESGRTGGPQKLGDLARQIVGEEPPRERPKRRAAPRPAEDFDPTVPDEETERLKREQIERLRAASRQGAA